MKDLAIMMQEVCENPPAPYFFGIPEDGDPGEELKKLLTTLTMMNDSMTIDAENEQEVQFQSSEPGEPLRTYRVRVVDLETVTIPGRTE